MNELKNGLKTLKGNLQYIFSVEFVMNNMYLMALIVGLCVLTIENRYECDKQFRQIEKLKRVLQDKKNEALAVNADLSQLSRQSNVKNMISESSVDVAESTLPPFMIKK